MQIGSQGAHTLLWPAIAFLMAAFMIKERRIPLPLLAAGLSCGRAYTDQRHVIVRCRQIWCLWFSAHDHTPLCGPGRACCAPVLIFLGIIGVIFGGLSALGTHNVKRMLAYSTLAQIGFILIGIGWGTALSITAAIIFAFNHSLIKAAMIMLAGYVASRTSIKSAAFDIITGVGKPLPAAGLLFFLGSLALAGIPPTNGFVSKMFFFESGIRAEGYIALLLVGLASIFTLMYTIRAFQRIWWRQPITGTGAAAAQPVAGDQLLAPAILVVFIMVLGIWAAPLVGVAQRSSAWLGDPAIYIQAVLGG